MLTHRSSVAVMLCLVALGALSLGAPDVAAPPPGWVRTRLFDGRTLKGWLESGGEWTIRGGWMIGSHKGDSPPMMSCLRTLPNEFDLSVKGRCVGGYLCLGITNVRDANQAYSIDMGRNYNRELTVLGRENGKIKTYLNIAFSCVAGKVYEVTIKVRPDSVEFWLDGKRLTKIEEVTALDARYRLGFHTYPRRSSTIAYSQVILFSPAEEVPGPIGAGGM